MGFPDNAPLYKAVEAYATLDKSRFFTPGHKGVSPLSEFFGSALKYDVTELPQTDSLYDADGAIYEAEKAAAACFGAQSTLFSAGGATLCIQTMLKLARKKGTKLICARNVHRSVANTMVLLGMQPVWVYPRKFEKCTLPGAITAEDVETELKANPDACAVFVTSPDYYGVMSDIKGIAAVCAKYCVPLLADNSHGSHLFYTKGDLHPLQLGADMTCDSAHKTLPVLTGGAFLHIKGKMFSYEEAKEAMRLFGSTSPSYLIMLSLDLARAWLEINGREAYKELCDEIAAIKTLCENKEFDFVKSAFFEPARLTLDFGSVGYTGAAADDMLYEAGISSEMHDDRYVVLLPSPFNKKLDFIRLKEFLEKLEIKPPIKILNAELVSQIKMEAVMPLRDAAYAESEFVPVEVAAMRIAAECRIPCPPGVPVVMPGELITHDGATILKNYGVLNIKVVK